MGWSQLFGMFNKLKTLPQASGEMGDTCINGDEESLRVLELFGDRLECAWYTDCTARTGTGDAVES